MADISIAASLLREIPPATLYRLLALRVEVFVVEQGCPYRELDGRDLESGTRLVWAERGGDVVATLRVLAEADGTVRIGRVATAVDARHLGIGTAIVRRGLELAGDRSVVLAAQTHLARWYATFGFVRDGEDHVEDGIPHTPMRLQRVAAP